MLPNLANIAEINVIQKICQFLAIPFHCQKFAIFQTPAWLLILTKFIKLNTKTLESTAQICCYMSEYDLLLEEML